EPIRRDDVAGEWRTGERIDRRRRRAAGDGAAEVAGALRGRRDERRAHRPALLAVPFLRVEELHPILDNRSAERAAEIVALQLLFRLVGLLQEVVLRVQRVVASGVEPAAVEGVGAAAG